MSSAVALANGIKTNLALVVRDVYSTQLGKNAGFTYDTIACSDRPPFLGLDVNIVNNGATVATIWIDGIPTSVAAGLSKSFSNFPFKSVQVISGTSVDFNIQGLTIDLLNQITAARARQGKWL